MFEPTIRNPLHVLICWLFGLSDFDIERDQLTPAANDPWRYWSGWDDRTRGGLLTLGRWRFTLTRARNEREQFGHEVANRVDRAMAERGEWLSRTMRMDVLQDPEAYLAILGDAGQPGAL